MNIREHLIGELVKAGGFWSYDEQSVRSSISDEQLIEATLEKLDLDDIALLFELFPLRKIKSVWLNRMVGQGDYYYSLNRFYAWYYFGVKNPDRYLKAMQTRRLSKLIA